MAGCHDMIDMTDCLIHEIAELCNLEVGLGGTKYCRESLLGRCWGEGDCRCKRGMVTSTKMHAITTRASRSLKVYSINGPRILKEEEAK
jgi:hypothetical protein